MIHLDFGAALRNTNFGIHFYRPDEISATEISLGRQRRQYPEGLFYFLCDLCVSSEAGG
jgi:hypothetical protein